MGTHRIKRSAVCPTCEDTMTRADQERTAAQAAQAQQALEKAVAHRRANIELILTKAGVPPRYKDCSQATYQGKYPNIMPAYICGPIGTGKTHLAVALLRDHILECETQTLPPVRFVRMVDLLKEIRQTFKEDSQVNEQDLLIYYGLEVELLVLDDLGVEKITDWVLQTLYDLIDKRYVELKSTIITSNIPLKDFERLYGEMGKRLASRIVGIGDIWPLQGEDRRI